MPVTPEYADSKFDKDSGLPDITLDPVIKSNWKTLGARDYWSPALSEFVKLTPEFLIETLQTPNHPRTAFIIDTTEDGHTQLPQLIADTDLSYKTIDSDLPREDRPFPMFTDYVNAVSIIDKKPSDEYAVMAASDDIAQTVVDLLDPENDGDVDVYRELASIFGYPDCCIDAHERTAEHGLKDPLYEIACNTESATTVENNAQHVHIQFPDTFLNQFWRYHGFRFTYHLPCSYECDASGRRARTNYEMYKSLAGEANEEAIDKVLAWLDQPLSWSAYHALTHLKNAYGIGTYHTDNNWEKKEIIWVREHQNKPELEPNHFTSELERIDPEYGVL